MEFRPCIDIHNGQVKQIVGSSLDDTDDLARENFVAAKGADHYARLYRDNGIKGGHIIRIMRRTGIRRCVRLQLIPGDSRSAVASMLTMPPRISRRELPM